MQSKAILCVDDEEIVLMSLKEQIEDHFGDNFMYEVAESAEKAWEVIEDLNEEEVEILLIVSDWLMPGIKGDEFLIAVHQRFPQIVKVILTGQADEKAIERAIKEANLHRCLRKPWKVDELIETIQSGLGMYE
ncbi:MAG: response regulator [Candidatus Parabeggiatoa sp. nov. 3]|jgi:CheY-like chemotaxis protein|nr:MAG: response regulator [Gammaproteobacteria bacterium]RKZ62147.1 MAG: response regulator [Gammaproteobacteria bacterium]RKZ78648.1 MAG: response regulator [Gammaproteobacteria bacterium]